MFTQPFNSPSSIQYLYILSLNVKGKFYLESALLRLAGFMLYLSDRDCTGKNRRGSVPYFFLLFKNGSLASFRTVRKDGQRCIRFINFTVYSNSLAGNSAVFGSKRCQIAVLSFFFGLKACLNSTERTAAVI